MGLLPFILQDGRVRRYLRQDCKIVSLLMTCYHQYVSDDRQFRHQPSQVKIKQPIRPLIQGRIPFPLHFSLASRKLVACDRPTFPSFRPDHSYHRLNASSIIPL